VLFVISYFPFRKKFRNCYQEFLQTLISFNVVHAAHTHYINNKIKYNENAKNECKCKLISSKCNIQYKTVISKIVFIIQIIASNQNLKRTLSWLKN